MEQQNFMFFFFITKINNNFIKTYAHFINMNLLLYQNIIKIHCAIGQSFYFINESIILKFCSVIYFLTNGF